MPTNQILQLLTKQGKKLDTEIAKTIGLTVDMTRSYLLGRNDRRWQDNVLPYYSVWRWERDYRNDLPNRRVYSPGSRW